MRRVKKHKVKQEQPEASSSARKDVERDLTYYIHDRVELMHQVFSVLKPKELKAMAPQCVQYISMSDLQELCTEELLGISSKRLCAILDGAEPPSDTDSSSTSSSPEKLETISLDSISSDEEILSEGNSKKKKHRHRRRNKSKTKHKHNSSSENSDNDLSKANRAGLTVLELLELQARARAIRAQLQQEQINIDVTDLTGAPAGAHASDDEVEIKEEPAEVVEISSEDEKPNVEDLQKEIVQSPKNSTEPASQEGQAVTKRLNDLIITVPQAKPTRKIKLNRNKSLTTVQNATDVVTEKSIAPSSIEIADQESNSKTIDKANKPAIEPKKTEPSRKVVVKEKQKKKQKKKGKESANKDGSDHDEITLELSDSEKMDLLEDLDRKNFENVSSSCTEDSESSSISEDDKKKLETKKEKHKSDKEAFTAAEIGANPVETKTCIDENAESKEIIIEKSTEINEPSGSDHLKEISAASSNQAVEMTTADETPLSNESENLQEVVNNQETCSNPEITLMADNDNDREDLDVTKKDVACELVVGEIQVVTDKDTSHKAEEVTENITKKNDADDKSEPNSKQMNRDLSEGELSDRESSEVEASDVKPEVVCISDDDVGSKKSHKKKKNKKKEKKSKKEKKAKKSPDFRKDADQNFFKESHSAEELPHTQTINNVAETISLGEEGDVYEILELSSDSSCNEDETAVLSKEPTKEEIEALSARIDEIEREEVVTEEQIKAHERSEAEKTRECEVENISWKDRYLDSKKVKTVLSTSSIFNAMRKKNKELKRKLEEAKKHAAEVPPEVTESADKTLEEGSIEHYNTLEGSTKYVEPIPEDNEVSEDINSNVTKEMKKDAKQLLKMYKKLLKYNDMNHQSNPNKKKKKKQKKNKADKAKDEKTNSVEIDIGEKIVS